MSCGHSASNSPPPFSSECSANQNRELHTATNMIVIQPHTGSRVPFGRACLEQKVCRIAGSCSSENTEPAQEIVRLRALNVSSESDRSAVVYEELYACGLQACVTRLPQAHAHVTRTFTTDQPIQNAFWYWFKNDVARGCPESAHEESEMPAVCLLTKDYLQVNTVNDHQLFYAGLPYQMNNVYPTKFGLIFERKAHGDDREQLLPDDETIVPLLFTLTHPLNELLPVILKPREHLSSARYACALRSRVVWSSTELPLVVTFDQRTGLHSIWLVKRASNQEALQAAELLEQSISLAQTAPGSSIKGTPHLLRTPTYPQVHKMGVHTPVLHQSHSMGDCAGSDALRAPQSVPHSLPRSRLAQPNNTNTNTSTSGAQPYAHGSSADTMAGVSELTHGSTSVSVTADTEPSTSANAGAVGGAGSSLMAHTQSNSQSQSTFTGVAGGTGSARMATRSLTKRAGNMQHTQAVLSPVVHRLMQIKREQQSQPASASSVRSRHLSGKLMNAHTPEMAANNRPHIRPGTAGSGRMYNTPRNGAASSLRVGDTPSDWASELGVTGAGAMYFEADPLIPDVCLEWLWTENSRRTDQSTETGTVARKVFIAEDCVQQKYLCYLVDLKNCDETMGETSIVQSELRCVKLTVSNTTVTAGCSTPRTRSPDDTTNHSVEQRVLIGQLTLIDNVRDAQAIKNQTIVLDGNNTLNMYSGVNLIGPVFVGAAVSAFDCTLSADTSNASHNAAGPGHLVSASAISTPARFLGTMPPPVNTISLSPVPMCLDESVRANHNALIGSFGAACDQLLTLNMLTGHSLLYKMPSFVQSKIVRECMQCVCQLVGRERAMQLCSGWCLRTYQLQHTNHAHALTHECQLFMHYLAVLIGLPLHSIQHLLTSTNESSSASHADTPAPKRRKHSNQNGEPSDQDFADLLVSETVSEGSRAQHSLLSFGASHVSNLLGVKGTDQIPENMHAETTGNCVDTSSALFAQCASVLVAVHYSYVEAALHRHTPSALLHSMALFIHQTASVFGWSAYSYAMEQDYPQLAGVQYAVQPLAPGVVSQVQMPRGIHTERSAHVYGAVCRMLQAHTAHTPLLSTAQHRDALGVPTLPGVHRVSRSAHVAATFALFAGVVTCVSDLQLLLGKRWASKCGIEDDAKTQQLVDALFRHTNCPRLRASTFLRETGVDTAQLSTYPNGLALCLYEVMLSERALAQPRLSPLQTTGTVNATHEQTHNKGAESEGNGASKKEASPSLQATGFESFDRSPIKQLIRLRFPQDVRVNHMRSMLDSSTPVLIPIKQTTGQTDGELRDQQEAYLVSSAQRTASQPFGRAMCTLRSVRPLVGQTIPAPDLCTHGIVPPRNLKIELNNTENTISFDWAHFHNGVAAGLQIVADDQHDNRTHRSCKSSASSGSNVDSLKSAWVVYNLPAVNEPCSPKDAGFLLGLGLNGHLAHLNPFHIHEYLIRGGEQHTSIAVLLGMAASHMGTAHVQTMRALCTHLLFLLPPTHLELQIDPLVQTAAVLGVGVLFAGTGHTSLADALLKEITRPATADNDPWPEREAYTLACGMALGWITMGQGRELNASSTQLTVGQSDTALVDRLFSLINGGHKPSWYVSTVSTAKTLTHCNTPQTEFSYPNTDLPAGRQASCHIRECSLVNTHMTCPGATLALLMMYMKTNDVSVADRLQLPNTLYLLDAIRPDMILLRVLARCLVLWDEVQPSVDWVQDQAPDVCVCFFNCLQYLLCFLLPAKEPSVVDLVSEQKRLVEEDDFDLLSELDVDGESVAQCYMNACTGACLAMAIRMAGTHNQHALKTLLHCFGRFFDDPLTTQLRHDAGSWTVQTCVNTLLIAMGIVMAGSGNLDVMRVVRMYIRHKQKNVSATASSSSTDAYSRFMSAHITLGLLYLGAGAYSLRTDNTAVCAMVCAFYPRFPATLDDSKQYLQAIRHFWVLAVERRVLCPVDAQSGQLTSAHLTLHYKDVGSYTGERVECRAPCMLPELDCLTQITVHDPRYWPQTFNLQTNKQIARFTDLLVNGNGELTVLRRAGFLTYEDDETGFKSETVVSGMLSDDWQPVQTDCGISDSDWLVQADAACVALCTKQQCAHAYAPLMDLLCTCENGVVDGWFVWQCRLLTAMQTCVQTRDTTNCVAIPNRLLLHLTTNNAAVNNFTTSRPELSGVQLAVQSRTLTQLPMNTCLLLVAAFT